MSGSTCGLAWILALILLLLHLLLPILIQRHWEMVREEVCLTRVWKGVSHFWIYSWRGMAWGGVKRLREVWIGVDSSPILLLLLIFLLLPIPIQGLWEILSERFMSRGSGGDPDVAW